MNKQNISDYNKLIQNSKNNWITIIAVIITAIVVGGGIYAWQASNLKFAEKTFQQQITLLQNQINQLQQAQQNQQTNQQIAQPTQLGANNNIVQSPPQTLCEDNGGKFLGVVEVTNGGYSKVCLLPGGKYCEEFGYNKCVESKGSWQP